MGLHSSRFCGLPYSARGFTLLELMFAIAIAAVILAVGAPSFAEFRRNARLTSVANDFLAATQLARTEAIKRRTTVSICPSSSASSNAPACDSADFGGWIIFEDSDRSCTREAAEAVICGEAPINDAGVSDTFRVTAAANGGCVSIASTGYVDDRAALPSLTRIVYCDARGIAGQGGSNRADARALAVDANGRARITREADVISAWGIDCP
ncbi:MAG: GspH/FimT family pseudopilin [Steroidobacteraceae bacterium]